MTAIHRVFLKYWKEAIIPTQRKLAEVNFFEKKSYYDPSAYRPISLTSYPRKSLGRILTHRLYVFSEHFNLLDPEQEGFRRFRGTTYAILRLTQDTFNVFNNKEHIFALFIDIEKAFDSVWREGLMFKLHKLGIGGRMWKWIKSFINDRKAFTNMKGDKRVQNDIQTSTVMCYICPVVYIVHSGLL